LSVTPGLARETITVGGDNMMRKKVAICVLAVSLIAAGCGQANKAAVQEPESKVSADSYVSSPSDTVSVASSVMDSVSEDPETVPGEPDEKPDENSAGKTDKWVDVSKEDPGDEVSTDSTLGEGFNVIPGEVITASENSSEVKVGETVTVESPRGTFDLTIDSIRLTNERSAGIRADRVVEVTYTYANTHNFPDLLVGDTCFMLTDSEGRACAPYIFDPTGGNHPQPMPIGSGEQFTSSFGFILPEDGGSSVTLLYKASFEDPDSFEFNVKADL
jgi:hypothetical protein